MYSTPNTVNSKNCSLYLFRPGHNAAQMWCRQTECWLKQLLGCKQTVIIVYSVCRGKSGGRRNLGITLNVQWTQFTAKSEFQMTTTEHGFHLKSGFRKIVWPPNMVSVLFLDSQKYCVHRIFLYTCQEWSLGWWRETARPAPRRRPRGCRSGGRGSQPRAHSSSHARVTSSKTVGLQQPLVGTKLACYCCYCY